MGAINDVKKVLVLVSGGLDSAVCLAMAVDTYGAENVTALNMFYGQKHVKELMCAEALCAHYGVKHLKADLSTCFKFSDCALLQGREEISHESYADQLAKRDTVSAYVPFRNGLFLSYATAIAYSVGASYIYYGAHADDAAGNAYPDCSETFRDAMGKAMFIGTGRKVSLVAPLINMNKATVVKTGMDYEVPFEMTWSCYGGKEKQCGTCGTCRDRINAFKLNGIEDPVPYELVVAWEH